MSRARIIALGAALVGVWCVAAASPAAASAGPSSCGAGAALTEALHAPASATTGSAFTVHITIHNCTSSRQSGNLEGKLTAPAPCSAPVVDPLPLTLQPHQRFSTSYRLQATSCTGTYRVQVSVVQGSSVLASGTVDIRIT